MATKFAQFLKDSQLDPRRLLLASKKVEQQRAAEAPKKEAAEKDAKKAATRRRAGRPITPRLLHAATEGKAISGPAKTRLLRALNHVLALKKKPAAELRQVF